MKRNLVTVAVSAVVLSLLFSACTTSRSHYYDYDHLFIKKQGVIQRPVMADIEVMKDKRTITRTYKYVTVTMAKEMILVDFVKEFNADLIVQPMFATKTESTNNRTTVEITLMGFPAVYKNFRNYEPKDAELLLPIDHLLLPSAPSRLFSTAEYLPTKKKSGLTNISSILPK